MDVTKLVGVEVTDKKDGSAVHEAIENRADEGRLEVEEMAYVYKTDNGNVKSHYFGLSGFGIGASIGGGLGLGVAAAGVLGIINPIVGVGLIGGMTTGGFIGHFFSKHFVGREFLADIGDGLEAGKGYVLVATDDAGADFLESDSSTNGHRVAHIDVTPAFLEDLGKAVEEAASDSSE